MREHPATHLMGALLLCTTLQLGCLGDRCGPDQKLEALVCVPTTIDAQPGDAAATDAATTDAATADANLTGLGDECTDSPDCDGAADYCAKQPTQETGYCTYQGCDPANDDCPPGYTCLDLSVFDEALPTACTRS